MAFSESNMWKYVAHANICIYCMPHIMHQKAPHILRKTATINEHSGSGEQIDTVVADE